MNYKEITSWEAACKVHGIDPTALPEVSKLPVKFQQWLIDAYKLGVITEAMNTDEQGKVWVPDYNDTDQIKYFPWFEVKASEDKPSGFGFSNTHYGGWNALTDCGSRLCFDNSDKVFHIQKHFEELFISFHLIKD